MKEAADMVDKRMSLFVRNVLRGVLAFALLGGVLSVRATDDIAGRPNFLEGGRTYYYPTAQGNVSDADWDAQNGNPRNTTTNNVYGRLPQMVVGYIPPVGQTNVVYLTRDDAFSVATNYEFRGTSRYTDSRVTGSGNYGGRLSWEVKDGFTVFRPANGTPPTDFDGDFVCSCYFTHTTESGTEYARLDVSRISRSDAFYRTPLHDTYYVVSGAQLWFKTFRSAASSPWVMDGGANWSAVIDTANIGFDKFTVTAPAGTDFHLTSEDGARDIAVHVVDPNAFSFRKYNLYFNGTNEVRRLSTILYECNTGHGLTDVAQVVSADPTGIEVVELADGDWTLQATGFFDIDREVTVRLANGSIILLKITSTPGRYDESMCASVRPIMKISGIEKALLNDAGVPSLQPCWSSTTKTDNAPPGYTNVMCVLNAVLYKGRRYSVYIAAKEPDFVPPVSEPKPPQEGVLWCVISQHKIVCWLEDEDGRLFNAPDLVIGNSGQYQPHPAIFSLGLDNILYSNNPNLILDPYVGINVNDESGVYFVGATPDSYGYCTLAVCAQMADRGIDEMTVFHIEDVHVVTVSNEVFGGTPGERFLYEAIYVDCTGTLVTNRFSLADGESHKLMVQDGGDVQVTEVMRSTYETSVRKNSKGLFALGNRLGETNLAADWLFEFQNMSAEVVNPVELWITDHADAGSNKVHLAFEPIFAQSDVSLADWVKGVKQRKAVHIVSAAPGNDLRTAARRPVEFRAGYDPDPNHPWVWITADATAMATNAMLRHAITIDKEYPCYSGYVDEILASSAPSGHVVRLPIDAYTDAYVFTNAAQAASVQFNRASRLKSILLVGGGGAGGGMTGGGGGGGEVRFVTFNANDDVFPGGAQLALTVGKGGTPVQKDFVKFSNDSTSIDPISHSPGCSGGDTSLLLGDRQFVALGGGGGGSFRSTFPGVMTPLGLGMPGGNGGGSGTGRSSSDVATAGGTANASSGNCGGGAYPAEKRGAGGGGGMSAAGQNGERDRSGNGGEGMTLTIEGLTGVYGSGGGGGGNWQIAAGLGGTNAGKGGVYTTGQFTAANFPITAFGANGVDGFGGGGGGGAYLDGDTAVRGGFGGNGRVMFVLQNASVIDAVGKVKSIHFTEATLQARVVSLSGREEPVSVAFAYTRRGETMPTPTPLADASALAAGDDVLVPLDGLAAETLYDYVFEFRDEQDRKLVVTGSFETLKERYGNVAYEDAYLMVEGDPSASPLRRNEAGEYLLAWTGACPATRIQVFEDVVLARSLLVGGGGAGGSWIGGGGGGGGVTANDDSVLVPAGTEFTLTVGAGGAVLGQANNTRNENGSPTSLSFGSTGYSALGGGAGASLANLNGEDGANGGGGMKADGNGGRSIDGRGFAGGHGGQRHDNHDSVGGGGGGAGAPGEDSVKTVQTSAGTRSQAGHGGEGLGNNIIGTWTIYGSGGGAGADEGVLYGKGGTNAGDGGDHYAVESAHWNGAPGVAGTGGGGGGSGYHGEGHFGGAGGSGALVLDLFRADAPIVATSPLREVGSFAAQAEVKVLRLGAGVGSVKVELALKRGEGEWSAYSTLAESVAAGATIPCNIAELDADAAYAYRVRLTGANGVEKILESAFTTASVDFPIGYQDANLVVGEGLGANPMRSAEAGSYLIVSDVACTNVPILLKRPFTFDRALLVGGGGAGGSRTGGGGGGGGVTNMTETMTLPIGTRLFVSVGKGGAVLGSDDGVRNENGGTTTLQIGDQVFSIPGGGAGASWSTGTGWDGANGGGAIRNGCRGGLSTTGFGFPGGDGAKRVMNGYDCGAGGGGGAGGAGEKAATRTILVGSDTYIYAGHGGQGLAFDITGATVVYGAGGGGGAEQYVYPGEGGSGGGNGGSYYEGTGDGEPGTDGTGGGGGGAAYHGGGRFGGRGGCGTVILKLRVLSLNE